MFEKISPFIVLACAVLALCYSAFLFYSVKRKEEGTEKMKHIGAKIRQGAMAYLKRQYKTVSIFFAVMFVLLFTLAFATDGQLLSKFVPFAFVTGGFFSAFPDLLG